LSVAHIVVLSAALLTLLFLPCVVAALFCADEMGARRWWTRRGRREIGTLRRLDRALHAADPVPSLSLLDTPAIEQLAFDLRRLAQQRRGGPSQQSE
jgi:hypothetical protein